jgi:hypothetical protein
MKQSPLEPKRSEDDDVSTTATGSALPRVVASIVFFLSRDQGVNPSLRYPVSTVFAASRPGEKYSFS